MLNKKPHGNNDAPILWFEKIKYGLEDQNLDPRNYDASTLVSDRFICLLYVDDCIFLQIKEKILISY